MAVLIDPPIWPAHGTVWSHLVSDSSLTELHEFAKELRVPRRSFDLDHYDLTAARYEEAIALGAEPVGGKELVRRLRASGLRVRGVDRVRVGKIQRAQFLQEEWNRLFAIVFPESTGTASAQWLDTGTMLLHRWEEPHRHYHDAQHLEEVLLSLDLFEVHGVAIAPGTLLAAWFHDAVYNGRNGDEQRSAHLAVLVLARLGVLQEMVSRVGEAILATSPSAGHTLDHQQQLLLDADLNIFASKNNRYMEYVSDIRREYAHVPEADFRLGRSNIIRAFLKREQIFYTPLARGLWEEKARANLKRELANLSASVSSQP